MEAGFVSCCLECLNKTVMLQFRVEDKNCGTEIWTLSANAALVGHTMWMDHMQDASLQGVPESRKLVALVIGNTIYGLIVLDGS